MRNIVGDCTDIWGRRLAWRGIPDVVEVPPEGLAEHPDEARDSRCLAHERVYRVQLEGAKPQLIGKADDGSDYLVGIVAAALKRLDQANPEHRRAAALPVDISSGGSQPSVTRPDAPCRSRPAALFAVFSYLGQGLRIDKAPDRWRAVVAR